MEASNSYSYWRPQTAHDEQHRQSAPAAGPGLPRHAQYNGNWPASRWTDRQDVPRVPTPPVPQQKRQQQQQVNEQVRQQCFQQQHFQHQQYQHQRSESRPARCHGLPSGRPALVSSVQQQSSFFALQGPADSSSESGKSRGRRRSEATQDVVQAAAGANKASRSSRGGLSAMEKQLQAAKSYMQSRQQAYQEPYPGNV